MEKRNMVKLIDNNNPREASELKRYLICIEEQDGTKDWDIFIGRTAAYEYLKDNIEFINLNSSFILVETLKLSERKSIPSFMKYARQFFPNDNFDLDYYLEDYDEYEDGSNLGEEGDDNKREFMNLIEENNRVGSFNGETINVIPLN